MYRFLARALSLLALVVFAYVQYQGWSLFQDNAHSGHGSGGTSRSYHK